MDRSRKRKILSLSLIYPKENSFVSETEDVIYGCIKPPKDAVKAGKAISLPGGKFNLKLLLKKFSATWQPDLVSISSSLAQSSHPPLPTEVQNLSCPSVMKLTDSHHMCRPIQRLIEYSKAVDCHYHWTTYNRQHLHFYREAGLARAFWMPGAISIPPYETRPAKKKLYDVIFCGSMGNNHPYRAKLLNLLRQSGINTTVTRRSYTESLQAYAESKIVFNCSLNGDLNRRVFEVLMAGGFLLTDRLSLESGLFLLFEEGVHLECYGSEQELLDKVRYYLAHPDRAAEIARQGHQEFMIKYHPKILQEKFYNYVVKEQPIPDIFAGKDDIRLVNISDKKTDYTENVQNRIKIYELFQEIHRLNSKINLLYYRGENKALVSDLKDLSGLRIAIPDSIEEISNYSQIFDIVMIDSPSEHSSIKDLLEQLNPLIPVNGLLIILGIDFAKKEFTKTLKSSNLVPIKLRESGEKACLSYQKIARFPKKSRVKKVNLTLTISQPLSIKFLRKINSKVKQTIKT